MLSTQSNGIWWRRPRMTSPQFVRRRVERAYNACRGAAARRTSRDGGICSAKSASRGFSLVELMVSIALGLLVVAAVLTLYLNISRTNAEMAKTNSLIEGGRFALQVLQNDIVHAGFWGGYVPAFDDLMSELPPADSDPVSSPTLLLVPGTPRDLPDPCLAYMTGSTVNWTRRHKDNLIGIPVQVYGATSPVGGSGTGCVTDFSANRQANTDLLIVRHADTCVAGATNCDADTAGDLYFQAPFCEPAPPQAATATTVTLAPCASKTNDFYKDQLIRVIKGPGAPECCAIGSYVGSTQVATLAADSCRSPCGSTPTSSSWPVLPPKNNSLYTFGDGYALATTDFIFSTRPTPPTTPSTPAAKRRFVSNIYYVRDYAVTPGDGVPTLMRSSYGALAQGAGQALIEGIERFHVELGIDNRSETNEAVDYTAVVNWQDPNTHHIARNRGDGVPDAFMSCTGSTDCTTCTDPTHCTACSKTAPPTDPTSCVAQLSNVTTVALYFLVRSKEATPGYTDTKTYTLGSTVVGPFGDHFKRHVFSTSVRLTNVSGRRETP